MLDGWNKEWKITSPGLWFKIYPFCSAAYFGADVALKIGRLPVEEIEEVIITFSNNTDAALIHRNPQTCEEGRFSIEYIVSLILQGKPLVFENFAQKPIDELSQQIISKTVRQNVQEQPHVARYTKVKVTLKNGNTIEESSTTPKGSKENKVTKQELIEKCRSNLKNEEFEETLLNSIFSFDEIKSLSSFLSIL
ncbi:hypothetical protein UACE39S_03338 [Ureibacillus acetophenoni]